MTKRPPTINGIPTIYRSYLFRSRTEAKWAAFFDELGCLRDYLGGHATPADAVVYVADHRTGEWVTARTAVFTKTATSTPMGSGLLAHADAASRDADPAAAGGSAVVVLP